ncbi:hypothetical protein J4856_10110 [Prevotella scopos JCM 17725]|jgi:hypothetical protein|uniref:Uncharacterized protein n=1 Tax=Prevotella scopos JCM 17725 TaxID=1236518 RepID=A0AAX2F573_9BACT|nr:hypothetical protein [Prevotella scopos]ANR72675.1 hypothetical protein AXF22_04225 [Prevotella scopos JCM 17725]QUB45107.1 hypothetical protein J4856_10110 [Prevotella scopos JCM 17725]SHF95189.1 hypothetical protein SAMN05444364_12045 [Prevotella scopos JCM 17725]
MSKQTIDTYKLTGVEEPSDEVLSQLMREAAAIAKERNEKAHQQLFSQLRKEAAKRLKEWNNKNISNPITSL